MVVDDAMDAEFDIRSFDEAMRRVRPDATLLVSTRPRAEALLHAALGLSPTEAESLTVRLDDLELGRVL